MRVLAVMVMLLFWAGCTKDNGNDNQGVVTEQNASSSEVASNEENETVEDNATDDNVSVAEVLSYTSVADFKRVSFAIHSEATITPISVDVTNPSVMNNKAAYIPPQCFTKTEDESGNVHNPCLNCHLNSNEPNYINDYDLQEVFPFREVTHINKWSNLFKDRNATVSHLSDAAMLEYVRHDNYKDTNGSILLAERLRHVPEEWDANGNVKWDGYVPDCYFDFDSDGFDKAPDGSYTGWRAFAYYPFLGTFWPTNGSTDDVLIRLPEIFRQDTAGNFSTEVYKINLAVVEAYIKQSSIALGFEVDENKYGIDLDLDGVLGTASMVKYKWIKPSYDVVTRTAYGYTMHFVGMAYQKELEHLLPIAPGLYPKGTEFLHSVRYIDLSDDNSTVHMAKRMKELRYGRKVTWNTYPQLSNAASSEIKAQYDFPDRLRTFSGNAEIGLGTGQGWYYQGFIEDREGDLRPQSVEETMACIGCHSGIGATVDSTFVFPRKFGADAKQHGWYHWSQDVNGLAGIKEPVLADGRYEYTLYLKQNGAGDEFRDNDEVMTEFFEENGTLKADKTATLHEDIGTLLLPSPERAMALDKGYYVIVREQSYIYGRDGHIAPVANVHREVPLDEATGISAVKMGRYPLY